MSDEPEPQYGLPLRRIWQRGRYELLILRITYCDKLGGHTIKLPGGIRVGWMVSGDWKGLLGISAGAVKGNSGRTIILIREGNDILTREGKES